ncbi:MAG TPA: PaaI family thioesterase [Vicinamibacterales bacterium]|jgi:acyl-coenzyme A thioesterase PaaI-like protein
MTPPIPVPEPGWEPVVPFPLVEGTFLADGQRVRIAYFRKTGEPDLYARAWFATNTMGPPGHVHGGAIAATLDEAMGAAAWMNEFQCVAATIKISFLAMLPLETETTVEARIDRVEGRKIHLRSTLTEPSGKLIAEGTGLFIVLKDGALKQLNA